MTTHVASSLPEGLWPPGATITVTLDDASAVVTKLNVFGPSGVITLVPDPPVYPPLLPYEPDAV